jgi:hypothetical protein
MARYVSVLALACALLSGPGPANAAELFMIEHSRCPACIRFNATVGKEYSSSPQSRIAPLRRVKLDQGDAPAELKGTVIKGTPTFILMDEGRLIGRFDGFRDQGSFWSRLDALLMSLLILR